MSNQYPDIKVKKSGYELVIQTTFDASTGYWVTQLLDPSGQCTGKTVGLLTVGGVGTRNNTPELTQHTRNNYQVTLKRYEIK